MINAHTEIVPLDEYFIEPANVTTYYIGNDVPDMIDFADDHLFGADIATVVFTDNKQSIDELFNKMSEDDFDRLQNELGMNAVYVVHVGNFYCIHLEIEYISKDVMDYVMENFLVLGSHYDDISMLDLCAGKALESDNVPKLLDTMYDISGAEEDSEELEDLEEMSESAYEDMVEWHKDYGISQEFVDKMINEVYSVLK